MVFSSCFACGERPRRASLTRTRTSFNPSLLYGERRGLVIPAVRWIFVSILVPRTGNDMFDKTFLCNKVSFNPRPSYGERRVRDLLRNPDILFQPTSLVRGTTQLMYEYRAGSGVSTHVPRTGNDVCSQNCHHPMGRFNPRPSYGERREPRSHHGRANSFNPRPSYGERPDIAQDPFCEGGFNPRPSYGERPAT